jgi:hypothetical protein
MPSKPTKRRRPSKKAKTVGCCVRDLEAGCRGPEVAIECEHCARCFCLPCFWHGSSGRYVTDSAICPCERKLIMCPTCLAERQVEEDLHEKDAEQFRRLTGWELSPMKALPAECRLCSLADTINS